MSLEIYPGDDARLPEEYHFRHNITVRLYDEFGSLIDKEFDEVTLDFKKGEPTPPTENVENQIKWLIENGHRSTADNVISQNLLCANIADMCDFFYHSLDAARKLHTSVAYTLLRKPFLENLIVIEQLVSNESNFLTKFYSDINKFNPGKVDDNGKKALIDGCLSKLKSINASLLPGDFIYELRYDKNKPYSLFAYTNSAMHLVTTQHEAFKTQVMNMNFIFSSREEREELAVHYYMVLSYCMLYAIEIMEQYMFEKGMLEKKEMNSRRLVHFIWLVFLREDSSESDTEALFKSLQEHQTVKCKACQSENTIYKSDFYSLAVNGYINCKNCVVDLFKESDSFEEYIDNLMKKF